MMAPADRLRTVTEAALANVLYSRPLSPFTDIERFIIERAMLDVRIAVEMQIALMEGEA